jgi:hypothetical protein
VDHIFFISHSDLEALVSGLYGAPAMTSMMLASSHGISISAESADTAFTVIPGFSFQRFRRKLRYPFMYFAVAIRTDKDTFIELLSCSSP